LKPTADFFVKRCAVHKTHPRLVNKKSTLHEAKLVVGNERIFRSASFINQVNGEVENDVHTTEIRDDRCILLTPLQEQE
jgi:hypothetical protein